MPESTANEGCPHTDRTHAQTRQRVSHGAKCQPKLARESGRCCLGAGVRVTLHDYARTEPSGRSAQRRLTSDLRTDCSARAVALRDATLVGRGGKIDQPRTKRNTSHCAEIFFDRIENDISHKIDIFARIRTHIRQIGAAYMELNIYNSKLTLVKNRILLYDN